MPPTTGFCVPENKILFPFMLTFWDVKYEQLGTTRTFFTSLLCEWGKSCRLCHCLMSWSVDGAIRRLWETSRHPLETSNVVHYPNFMATAKRLCRNTSDMFTLTTVLQITYRQMPVKSHSESEYSLIICGINFL